MRTTTEQIKNKENEIIDYIIDKLRNIDLSIDLNKLKITDNKLILEVLINHNTKRIHTTILFIDIKYIFIKSLQQHNIFLSDSDIKMCGYLTKKNLVLKLIIELNK